jgi:hypothetical protein
MADPAFGDRSRKLRLEPWCPTGVADFKPTYPMANTPGKQSDPQTNRLVGVDLLTCRLAA